jgi:hypothetical protein
MQFNACSFTLVVKKTLAQEMHVLSPCVNGMWQLGRIHKPYTIKETGMLVLQRDQKRKENVEKVPFYLQTYFVF